MSDDIFDSMFEGHEDDFEPGEIDFGPNYVGKWPDAVLVDVQPLPVSQIGNFEIQLVMNLKGDSLKYTGKARLPKTVNADSVAPEKLAGAMKGNEITKNQFNSIAFAAGILKKGQVFGNVDTEEKYDRIVSAFRMCIGRTVPIEVRPQSVKNKVTGKYEPSDRFTEMRGLEKKG